MDLPKWPSRRLIAVVVFAYFEPFKLCKFFIVRDSDVGSILNRTEKERKLTTTNECNKSTYYILIKIVLKIWKQKIQFCRRSNELEHVNLKIKQLDVGICANETNLTHSLLMWESSWKKTFKHDTKYIKYCNELITPHLNSAT